MSEEQYIQKGFNAGYLMAKHKPELSKTMLKGFVDKESPLAIGFIAGVKEYEQEIKQPRTKNYTVNHVPKNSKSPEKNKGKDLDDMEK